VIKSPKEESSPASKSKQPSRGTRQAKPQEPIDISDFDESE